MASRSSGVERTWSHAEAIFGDGNEDSTGERESSVVRW
jgi:hypothetical protein